MEPIDIATKLALEHNETAVANRVRYKGVSRTHCRECDDPIPERRRETIQGVQLCVECQALEER